jgi:hypothetical protein
MMDNQLLMGVDITGTLSAWHIAKSSSSRHVAPPTLRYENGSCCRIETDDKPSNIYRVTPFTSSSSLVAMTGEWSHLYIMDVMTSKIRAKCAKVENDDSYHVPLVAHGATQHAHILTIGQRYLYDYDVTTLGSTSQPLTRTSLLSRDEVLNFSRPPPIATWHDHNEHSNLIAMATLGQLKLYDNGSSTIIGRTSMDVTPRHAGEKMLRIKWCGHIIVITHDHNVFFYDDRMLRSPTSSVSVASPSISSIVTPIAKQQWDQPFGYNLDLNLCVLKTGVRLHLCDIGLLSTPHLTPFSTFSVPVESNADIIVTHDTIIAAGEYHISVTNF